MHRDKVVAIDGPSGSGKSSIAKAVSNEMDFLYVDTGAMYRALGYFLKNQGIELEPSLEVNNALNELHFVYGESKSVLVKINGQDLTQKIREHHVSELASLVSQIKEVREFLTQLQREIVEKNVCIMEGRDIGTVVFPNSFCKIYLTATPEVRAQRRFDQLKEKGTLKHSLEQILEDVKSRDERDMNRKEAPLKQAEDATMLDTSNMSFDEVVLAIKETVAKKAQEFEVTI